MSDRCETRPGGRPFSPYPAARSADATRFATQARPCPADRASAPARTLVNGDKNGSKIAAPAAGPGFPPDRRAPNHENPVRKNRPDKKWIPIISCFYQWFWRMGWDSNPRYAYTHGGFQDRCLQPLGHPSRARTRYAVTPRISSVDETPDGSSCHVTSMPLNKSAPA